MFSVGRSELKSFFSKKSGLLFFLIFLCFLLFIFIVLHSVKRELQSHCLEDAKKNLALFIEKTATGVVVEKSGSVSGEELYGLDFVRLIRGKQQLFHSLGPTLDFQKLSNIDSGKDLVWFSIEDVEKRGSWCVVSSTLDNGSVVQGGKNYPEITKLYKQVELLGYIAAVFSLLLSFFLVYLCKRWSMAPLVEAHASLHSIIGKKGKKLLNSTGNRELEKLYSLLNEILDQNNQLIKEMQDSLDNVAHDLRTPMTRLRSVAEYGLQKQSHESLSEALSDCLEESERVLSMLQIMMSVAEAESGTMTLKKKRFTLKETILDAVNLYEYVAEEKNILLEVEVSDELYIFGDKTRITQVWANLFDNGIKYGKERGMIRVYATKETDKISLVFEDNGIGITAQEIGRIWERLYRGDRSRTEQGLGLGLNYVRAVVEAHGGEVFVQSKLGEGSRFTVLLPAG